MVRVFLSLLLLSAALPAVAVFAGEEGVAGQPQAQMTPANPTQAEINQMANIVPATPADNSAGVGAEANANIIYGYYVCPWGYRLVYGTYLAVGWYWNGYGYVYGYYYVTGYYCVYP